MCLALKGPLICQKEASRQVIFRIEFPGLGAQDESGRSRVHDLHTIEPASEVSVSSNENRNVASSWATDRFDIFFRDI